MVILDLGGSRIKASVFSQSGIKYVSYRKVSYIEKGLINTENYVRNTISLLKDALKNTSSEKIYLGLCSQRASMVGWSRDLDILTPTYTWKHSSGWEVIKSLKDIDLGPYALFLQPGSGILRIKFINDKYRDIDFVGGLESLITYYLTKNHIVSYSLAYPYGTLDPFSMEWINEIIDLLDIPIDTLPIIVSEYLENLEFKFDNRNIVFSLLIADQSASLVGNGALEKGRMKITMGTGCFLDLYTGSDFIGDPNAGVNPMLLYVNGGPKFMAEYFIYHWGDILDWVNEHMYRIDKIPINVDFAKLPLSIPTLDYLSTEFQKSLKKFSLFGLDLDHSIKDISLAILYSMLALLNRGYSNIKQFDGINMIYLDGGWSLNRKLVQVIASILGRPVILRKYRNISSMVGAASMIYGDGELNSKLIDNLNPVEDVIEPANLEYWDKYVERFNNLLNEFF